MQPKFSKNEKNQEDYQSKQKLEGEKVVAEMLQQPLPDQESLENPNKLRGESRRLTPEEYQKKVNEEGAKAVKLMQRKPLSEQETIDMFRRNSELAARMYMERQQRNKHEI
jgi:hypothetical protein